MNTMMSAMNIDGSVPEPSSISQSPSSMSMQMPYSGYMLPPVPLFGAGEAMGLPFILSKKLFLIISPSSYLQAAPMLNGPSMPNYFLDSLPCQTTSSLLQELQDLDHRITMERTVTQQTMSSLQNCEPSSLANMKVRF